MKAEQPEQPDVEQVLAEWEDTQADDPRAAAVVRGMAAEIRRARCPDCGKAL